MYNFFCDRHIHYIICIWKSNEERKKERKSPKATAEITNLLLSVKWLPLKNLTHTHTNSKQQTHAEQKKIQIENEETKKYKFVSMLGSYPSNWPWSEWDKRRTLCLVSSVGLWACVCVRARMHPFLLCLTHRHLLLEQINNRNKDSHSHTLSILRMHSTHIQSFCLYMLFHFGVAKTEDHAL